MSRRLVKATSIAVIAAIALWLFQLPVPWYLSIGILALVLAVGAVAYFFKGRRRIMALEVRTRTMAIGVIIGLSVAAFVVVGLIGWRTVVIENRTGQGIAELQVIFVPDRLGVSCRRIPSGQDRSVGFHSLELKGVSVVMGTLEDGTKFGRPYPISFTSATRTVRIVVGEEG